MTFFGSKHEKAKSMILTPDQPDIEALADKEEKNILARSDDVYQKCLDEHNAQFAGFAFDCRRHGDFIAIFITRSANSDDYYGEPQKEFSTSLNIAKTRSIQLTKGRAPDRKGDVSYSLYHEWSDGQNKPKAYAEGVAAIPTRRQFVEMDPTPQPGSANQFQGTVYTQQVTRAKRVTHNQARPAVDDKIRFEGIGATLYVPTGKGDEVLAAILDA